MSSCRVIAHDSQQDMQLNAFVIGAIATTPNEHCHDQNHLRAHVRHNARSAAMLDDPNFIIITGDKFFAAAAVLAALLAACSVMAV